MIKAWISDVTSLYERECYEKYYEQLPGFRKKKADALRFTEMRAQSVGVWSLWDRIRKQYSLPEHTAVNFSHSGTYVMCAVEMDGTEDAVGCDIQKTGEYRPKVAERFFCPEEYESIQKENAEERAERFYRYWVLKESFMKATGRGMALPVDSFCIRLGNPSVLIRQPEEFTEEYYYMEYECVGIPYKMAVCSTDSLIDTAINMDIKL